MASIKVKFRPSTVTGHEGAVYYQIIHERKVRHIPTDYRVFPSEWDARRSMVVPQGRSCERRPRIAEMRERIRRDMERILKIMGRLEATGLPYSADDIIDEFAHYAKEYTMFNFMESIITKLKQNGKIRTAETYKSALNSFRRYRGGRDIMLDCITSEIMEGYEAWHRQRGLVPNTISFYNRILRAVYNRATEYDIIENNYPFRHVYTGVDKTVKRALPLGIIRKIKALDLSGTPTLDFARNMFMMSFYLRGMSFVDMAFLRKTNLRHGYITYRRRKTGQLLTIKWTKEMQTMLARYPENRSDYLLPIIRNRSVNERCAYRNAAYNINHNLKRIAAMVGVTVPLTLYVARHSWASVAKAKGIPVSVISEGMGHDSEATTQIYLASLDTSAIDKANSLILSAL